MSKKWTDDSARSYIAKVQNGKSPMGLTYCSAIDYLMNHASLQKIEEKGKKKNDINTHR